MGLLAAKPNDMSLIPMPHVVEQEKPNSHKLVPDLLHLWHMCPQLMYTNQQMPVKTIKKYEKFFEG